MNTPKKGKGRSILIIAFCIVILMLCLYAQYVITQQTKLSMLTMAQWQSSVEAENAENSEAENAEGGETEPESTQESSLDETSASE